MGAVGTRFEQHRRYEPACSGVVLYLGLKKRYEHLAHHDFVFSRDPKEEFNWIYKLGEPAPDPTCYLAATTCSEPATVPPGGEALYVLVHTPYLRPHHDWKRMLPEYRRVIIEKLKDRPDAGHRGTHRSNAPHAARHPRALSRFERGNLRPGEPRTLPRRLQAGKQLRDLRGLYLAGGAAHPGPGMLMVLMSGWIADTLDRDGVAERASVGAPRPGKAASGVSCCLKSAMPLEAIESSERASSSWSAPVSGRAWVHGCVAAVRHWRQASLRREVLPPVSARWLLLVHLVFAALLPPALPFAARVPERFAAGTARAAARDLLESRLVVGCASSASC